MAVLPLVNPNDELAKLWEKRALNLVRIDGQFPAIVRALGRLDSFLRSESLDAVDDFDKAGIPNAYLIEDYLTLSQLWVFGAYEMLRSLDDRLRTNPNLLPSKIRSKVNSLKWRFARIRVPLGKLEPHDRHKEDKVPRGACVIRSAREKGWCWQLNTKTYIWRHDLADELLSLLDIFPSPWSSPQGS
jgi:hypothetical protein